ncbi:hypothetical protein Tco_1548405 [Tanacetum coccineum]
MSMRIKMVVDKFVEELKEALEADIQDRIMKEREMQSYIQEREREVAEREAAWKAQLSRREWHISYEDLALLNKIRTPYDPAIDILERVIGNTLRHIDVPRLRTNIITG